MDPSLLTAVGLLLATGGGGIKYLMDRMDKKGEVQQIRFDAQVQKLEKEIQVLREEISTMERVELLYQKRIFQLEALLERHNIALPPLNGYPPK